MALNPITMTPLPGNETGGIFPGIDVGDLFLGIVFPFLFSISEFSWRIFWVFYANVCKCMPIGGRAWSVDSISWRWYGKIIISIGKWWSIEAADCISNSMPTDANGCKWMQMSPWRSRPITCNGQISQMRELTDWDFKSDGSFFNTHFFRVNCY